MDDVEGTPVGRYTLLQRIGLVSHSRIFPDDHDPYEFMGLLPMMRQWVIDGVSSLSYDLAITLKIVAEDQPFLRRVLRPIHRWLGKDDNDGC